MFSSSARMKTELGTEFATKQLEGYTFQNTEQTRVVPTQ